MRRLKAGDCRARARMVGRRISGVSGAMSVIRGLSFRSLGFRAGLRVFCFLGAKAPAASATATRCAVRECVIPRPRHRWPSPQGPRRRCRRPRPLPPPPSGAVGPPRRRPKGDGSTRWLKPAMPQVFRLGSDEKNYKNVGRGNETTNRFTEV